MFGEMKLLSTLFLSLCLLGVSPRASIASASTASYCDSMELVQTISPGPVDIFYIGIVSPTWCKHQYGWDPVVFLPRFTWSLEPAPEGATETTVRMSPPNLGTLLYDFDRYGDGVGAVRGIEINPTLNLTNGTDVGIAVQIPRDQLMIVTINAGSPFHVNIANGFTNIGALESDRSGQDYYCGDGEYEAVIAGRGSAVVADLSSSSDVSVLDINDNGADWTVKLPEDKSNQVSLKVDSLNGKVKILGGINCTDKYACSLLGGSHQGCTEDCATELVVEGSVIGNISVTSIVPQPEYPDEYTGNATVIITTTEPDGCEHFFIRDDDEVPFDCIYDAAATVQLEALPCTVAAGEGGSMDVLECQGETYEGRYTCNCAVPGVCPSPSPTPPPSSSSSTCAIMIAAHVVTFATTVLALVV